MIEEANHPYCRSMKGVHKLSFGRDVNYSDIPLVYGLKDVQIWLLRIVTMIYKCTFEFKMFDKLYLLC